MKRPLPLNFCPYDASPLSKNPKCENRRFCPQCDFVDYQNPKACVVIIVRRKKEILLARRAIEPAWGKWDIPGGFVDFGESVEDAVLREGFEELGLRLKRLEFIASIPDTYGPKRIPTINLCFTARSFIGLPRPRSDVDCLEWFSIDAPPDDMAFAHQRKVFQILTKGI